MLRLVVCSSLIAVVSLGACRERSGSKVLDGDKTGNGGTVVICSKPYPQMDNKTIMVTDLYEVKTNPALSSVKIPDEVLKQGYKAIAIHVIDRFERVANNMHKDLKTLVDAADPNLQKSDARIAANLHLPNLGDEGVILLPGEDCWLSYAAVQEKTDVPGNKTFNYDEKTWSQLDELNRAVLLVHEIVYMNRTSQYKNLKSKQIRYLVGAAFANNLPGALEFDSTLYGYMHEYNNSGSRFNVVLIKPSDLFMEGITKNLAVNESGDLTLGVGKFFGQNETTKDTIMLSVKDFKLIDETGKVLTSVSSGTAAFTAYRDPQNGKIVDIWLPEYISVTDKAAIEPYLNKGYRVKWNAKVGAYTLVRQ
jgi:hypothetical protein